QERWIQSPLILTLFLSVPNCCDLLQRGLFRLQDSLGLGTGCRDDCNGLIGLKLLNLVPRYGDLSEVIRLECELVTILFDNLAGYPVLILQDDFVCKKTCA